MELDDWDQQFATLLLTEGLNNRDKFLAPLDEFDEVPLYTRVSRISFLNDLDKEHRNLVLLKYALDYADSVVMLAATKLAPDSLAEFFLMVTVMNWDGYMDGEAIIPCFWITTRASEELVPMDVALPYSKEALLVESWIRELNRVAEYQVADYLVRCQDPALMRVHVGRRSLPRSEMRNICQLMR